MSIDVEITALSAALLSVDASLLPDADDKQLLIAAKVRGLMRGYDARWIDAAYEVVSVEEHIEADLVNSDTGRKSRTFRTAGKLDVVLKKANLLGVMDHKSTSQDITDPNSPYLRQLAIESQTSHYMLLGWQNGIKFDFGVWDIMRKPQTKPKELKKGEKAKIVADRAYFGSPLDYSELERLQIDDRESLGMYEIRLAHDCTIERPEWYFRRQSVPRLDAELKDYATELWDHGQEILNARNSGRHSRNSGACILYNSPCRFLGICSGHDSADSDKWRRKENVHAELPQLAGDGRDILTNSRIRCFQTCRQKHWLQYELGIEQWNEEEAEALAFGHLWHIALEAWFNFLKGRCNGDHDSSRPPVSEIGRPSGIVTGEANVTG